MEVFFNIDLDCNEESTKSLASLNKNEINVVIGTSNELHFILSAICSIVSKESFSLSIRLPDDVIASHLVYTHPTLYECELLLKNITSKYQPLSTKSVPTRLIQIKNEHAEKHFPTARERISARKWLSDMLNLRNVDMNIYNDFIAAIEKEKKQNSR